MCIHAIRNILGIPNSKPDTSQYEAAIKAAEAAAVTPADSEPARQAAENRLKKLLSGNGVGSLLSVPQLGAAQVGVRTLLGA